MVTAAYDNATMALVAGLPNIGGRERKVQRVRACALYARVSREVQQTVPQQLDAGRTYAATLGVPVGCDPQRGAYEFSDMRSGLRADRVGYQALLDVARAGLISHVVLFKPDRWGRDDVEFLTAFRELEHLGIEVHSTDVGRIEPEMAGLHGWLANREARVISDRTSAGMAYKAGQGLWLGRPPIGYRRTLTRGVLEPDPVTAPIIQELFARYAAGAAAYALVPWFHTATGIRKTARTLTRILRSPYYAGYVVTNRMRRSKVHGTFARPRTEWSVAQHNAPIIDEALWRAVQARLDGNPVAHERAAGPQFALSGLVWCNVCGLRMHGHHNRRDNVVDYVCGHCRPVVSKSGLKMEAALRTMLASVPLGLAAVQDALEADAARETTTSAQRARDVATALDRLHERRKRLTVLYADGELTARDYQAALAETDAELAVQYESQRTLEMTAATDASLHQHVAWLREQTDWVSLLDDTTPQERHAVYREVVSRLTYDRATGTLTVRWQPSIARLVGTTEQHVAF